ncbi:hypothetical protein SS50377_22268 [Spironucleus salmonicida]|uniref:Uncharacterized protein n=1 Tax=Spironucleus salmonicida TaxID=348837 RepID=V6LDC3_9EUKA|nr:hypothetical protein SS50377_22268 [Spironucleus salmonicida]|eukprot:EST42238.1 Hypothetical protein SS50377_18540 [Spironucleus salmonicida]
MSNQNIAVLGFKPYKYSKVSRQVTNFYQLIPSAVTFMSPFETTQYHPDDVIPQSIKFQTYPNAKKIMLGLFAWFFKFLEFYSVFYNLFRINPEIIHIVFDDLNRSSLFAIEVFCFMKKAKIVAHLASNKLVKQQFVVIEEFIQAFDQDKITVLYSDKEILNQFTIQVEKFVAAYGSLSFTHDMPRRVKLYTSQEFGMPEQVTDGIRTTFEYFKIANNMIQGIQHPQKPMLVVIPVTQSVPIEEVKQVLIALEQKAKEQQKQYVVVLTQRPCRREDQVEGISKLIKFCRNYYEPKTTSNNKLLNEKKCMSNVVVFQSSLTDLDFDLLLQLSDARVAISQSILFDMLSVKKVCIAYNIDITMSNVINQTTPEGIAACITEIAGQNLEFDGELELFEEILSKLYSVTITKELIFAVPQVETGGCCGGGCGDAACGDQGCGDENCVDDKDQCGSGCNGCK